MCSGLVQNLWRRPSCVVIVKKAPFVNRAFGYGGKTKIRDLYSAGVFYNDVRLYER